MSRKTSTIHHVLHLTIFLTGLFEPLVGQTLPADHESDVLERLRRASSKRTQATSADPFHYVYPYNMHLAPGETSSVPLQIRDQEGNVVSGDVAFCCSDDLISISSDGFVTALREERSDEIGRWVSGSVDDVFAANSGVVRVLSKQYDIPFDEIEGENSVLYYPATVNGKDIADLVSRYQLPLVNEYSYAIQRDLMGRGPFGGARQIIAVDFGESESQRVCGLAGNPFRLGWNLTTDLNCFVDENFVHWFVNFHELGHNFSLDSETFSRGLSLVEYIEGLASALAIETKDRIVLRPTEYPLEPEVRANMSEAFRMFTEQFFLAQMDEWLAADAPIEDLNANHVDAMWLRFRDRRGPDFGARFFQSLKPEIFQAPGSALPGLISRVESHGASGSHTFFAALMSAAVGEDLSSIFKEEYNYPINEPLFADTYEAALEAMPTAQAPAFAIVQSGSQLSGVVGWPVCDVPAVFVGDERGFAVEGVPVHFSIKAGDGAISGSESVTDDRGLAVPEAWHLGSSVGEQTMEATVMSLDGATVEITAQALPPAFSRAQTTCPLIVPINEKVEFESTDLLSYCGNVEVTDATHWAEVSDNNQVVGTPTTAGSDTIDVEVDFDGEIARFQLPVFVYDRVVSLSTWLEEEGANPVTVNGVVLSSPGVVQDPPIFDWGDGASSRSFFAASHTYSGPGRYRILTTAVNDLGNEMQACLTHAVDGGPNSPPTASQDIDDVELVVGDAPLAVNLAEIFGDPDGDELVFTAQSSFDSVAKVTVKGDSLFVSAVGLGSTKVTVVADDRRDGFVVLEFGVTAPTGVSAEVNELGIPERFALHPNYPNPFNPATTFAFDLPMTSEVTLEIFDVQGEKIATLVSGERPSGRHEVSWNASGVPSGVYFGLFVAQSFRKAISIVLLK